MRQPGKEPSMRVLQEHPLNAAPLLERLHQTFVTPREQFFVRNHGTIPQVRAEAFVLTITGMVEKPLRLTLEDLKQFPQRTVTATLMCAGNRRNELVEVAPIPDELLWDAGAISNAVWEGVALADVLAKSGIAADASEEVYVAFTGLDEIEKREKRFGFGGSIPLKKALASEVLLASAMNGEPLAPAHGYPLRVVIPGYIGARSVKWLANIHVQGEPSSNFYQARAYKLFPPDVTAATVDWSRGSMLGEAPITAAICTPEEGAIVAGEQMVICGYAYAGGRSVARVEVSWGGRNRWVEAELMSEDETWAWRLWRIALPLRDGTQRIVVRAWDGDGVCQPERLEDVWNFKGYFNTAWHTVTIHREK